MKLKVVIIIFLLSVYGHICAQYAENNIFINNVVIEQVGNALLVEMDINGQNADLSSEEKIVLTPVVQSGERTLELPAITINGKNRYKADKRSHYFNDKETDFSGAYKKKESSHIQYRNKTIVEPWMTNVVLLMKQEVSGCAGCKIDEWISPIGAENKPDSVIPKIKLEVSYLAPPTESVKNRNYVGSAYLEFDVGKAVIMPEFRNNSRELNKIEEALSQLMDDDYTTLTSIHLRGYASPDGRWDLNSRLSLERANALKTYLQQKYAYNTAFIHVSLGGEDWEDLDKLVSQSDLTDKDELLSVIRSYLPEDEKEQKLKTYTQSYTILLEHYYPVLRRVDYQANYVVRSFSVEEGKEILKTAPGHMSLDEMYLLANTYERGSKDFKEVFDVAVRLYPNDTIANLNAAAIELEDENLSVAHSYLDKYIQAPEAWNNVGVLYALEGNWSKAKEFFVKAKAGGSKEAVENLKRLEFEENSKATPAITE